MPIRPATAFLTVSAVADRLGVSYDTLRRRLPIMRAQGFPERDPLFNRYVAADVEAWIATRSKIAHDGRTETQAKVNYDAL